MGIPAILAGGAHLPLTERTLSSEAVSLCNTFYQTSLNAGDYKRSQAFRGADGKLYLELLNPNTGEVVITFSNLAEGQTAPTVETIALGNPLSFVSSEYSWLVSPVTVFSADELEFLDELGSGNTYPTEHTDNTLAWKLASLLNNYRVLGHWMSGTIGELCAGGFKLVYKGVASEAPEVFSLNPDDMVTVVQILHGSKRGFICLRV